MILADSNLIIYAAKPVAALVDWFVEQKPLVSAVSLVETLGYHKLNVVEKQALESLFAELTVLYPLWKSLTRPSSSGSNTPCHWGMP